MRTAHVTIDIRAPIDKVWGVLTDYAGYARIPRVDGARVLRPGKDHPAGVGAVREVSVLGSTFEEEIVEFVAPRRLGYKIVRSRPLPFDHQGGFVELSEHDGVTHLDWKTTFHIRLPVVGGLLTWVVSRVLGRTLGKVLVWIKADLEEAEARSGS